MNVNIYQSGSNNTGSSSCAGEPHSIMKSSNMHSEFTSDLVDTSTPAFQTFQSQKTVQPLDYTQKPRRSYAQHRQRDRDNNNNNNRQVFVGGLSYATTDDALRDYFGQLGTLRESHLIRDAATGRSRGFAFLSYEDESSVDEVMNLRPHVLDGRRLDVRRRETHRQANKNDQKTCKVFVGGLDESVDNAELARYFARFGRVENVSVKRHRDTNKTRGFGFVTFDDYDSVDKLMLLQQAGEKHSINSRQINVERALGMTSRSSSYQSENRIMSMHTTRPQPQVSNDVPIYASYNTSIAWPSKGKENGALSLLADQTMTQSGGGPIRIRDMYQYRPTSPYYHSR